MKKYYLKKNSHYSKGINIGFSMKHIFGARCMFDDSCLYQFYDEDMYDINKLWGYSTSYNHHKSSARFGWRCINNKIEIVTYTYDNKVRKQEHVLGVVEPYEEFEIFLEIYDNRYIYTFKKGKEATTYTQIITSKPSIFKYRLFPYFGGNKKCPHDMFLFFEEY